MAAFISIALAIWGITLHWVITFNSADTQPTGLGPEYVLAYSSPTIWPDGHISACNITYITSHVQNLSIQELQNVTTHEVGHCLGLNHISQPGIMAPTLLPTTVFTGYDRAEFWRHYPAPYRLTIQQLAR